MMRIIDNKILFYSENLRVGFSTRNHVSSGSIDCAGAQELDYAAWAEINGEVVDIEDDIFTTYDDAEARALELLKELSFSKNKHLLHT